MKVSLPPPPVTLAKLRTMKVSATVVPLTVTPPVAVPFATPVMDDTSSVTGAVAPEASIEVRAPVEKVPSAKAYRGAL